MYVCKSTIEVLQLLSDQISGDTEVSRRSRPRPDIIRELLYKLTYIFIYMFSYFVTPLYIYLPGPRL